jgi:hypothetical protein
MMVEESIFRGASSSILDGRLAVRPPFVVQPKLETREDPAVCGVSSSRPKQHRGWRRAASLAKAQ